MLASSARKNIGDVVVALLVIMLMSFSCSNMHTTTICGDIEFDSPLDSVRLVYSAPKDEAIIIWTCLLSPFGGDDLDNRSAVVNDRLELEECILLDNIPVDMRNRLSAVDFSSQRIVLVELTLGPRDRINYKNYGLKGNSVTLCFDYAIYQGGQPDILVQKQFIFAVQLSNPS